MAKKIFTTSYPGAETQASDIVKLPNIILTYDALYVREINPISMFEVGIGYAFHKPIYFGETTELQEVYDRYPLLLQMKDSPGFARAASLEEVQKILDSVGSSVPRSD